MGASQAPQYIPSFWSLHYQDVPTSLSLKTIGNTRCHPRQQTVQQHFQKPNIHIPSGPARPLPGTNQHKCVHVFTQQVHKQSQRDYSRQPQTWKASRRLSTEGWINKGCCILVMEYHTTVRIHHLRTSSRAKEARREYPGCDSISMKFKSRQH